MSEAEGLRAAALRYLNAHHVMTVATYGPLGLWAAAVFYASEDFTLFFLSAPHTRHATNIQAQPRVAVTVQEDYAEWAAIQGIQLEGEALALAGDEMRHAMAVFGARHPVVAEGTAAPGEILRALAGIRWYKVVPERLYWIDNSKGLGHRDEVPLPGG